MRTPKAEHNNLKGGLIVLVIACAAWILWHDIQHLFPLLGVVGGLLALREYQDWPK